MRCRSVLTRVDALRTGELAPAEQTAVEKHFETCSSCGDSVADVDLLASAMRTIIPAPTESCRQAIADRYEQIGDVQVVFSNDGLRLIRRGGTLDELRAAYARRFCRTLVEGTLPPALRKQVTAALAGEGVSKPRVDWSRESTDLEREVYSVLERIPRGEVRTYEWVARQAGHPRAIRAVGNILARNPVPLVVPCHRVVPASGGTGNYIFGSDAKRELLRAEGVDVDALDTLADAGVRYLGSRTTKIACFPTCRDARRIREENRVPFRDASQALEKGFRPCRHCQPFAA
jgi:O-6-methylguanine DNA methyltransferase